jgi:hypothetical protein
VFYLDMNLSTIAANESIAPTPRPPSRVRFDRSRVRRDSSHYKQLRKSAAISVEDRFEVGPLNRLQRKEAPEGCDVLRYAPGGTCSYSLGK